MVSSYHSFIIYVCVMIAFFLYSAAVDMSITMYIIGATIIAVGGVVLIQTSKMQEIRDE